MKLIILFIRYAVVLNVECMNVNMYSYWTYKFMNKPQEHEIKLKYHWIIKHIISSKLTKPACMNSC